MTDQAGWSQWLEKRGRESADQQLQQRRASSSSVEKTTRKPEHQLDYTTASRPGSVADLLQARSEPLAVEPASSN